MAAPELSESQRALDPSHDLSYGYALPGRRYAQIVVTSIVLCIVALVAAFLPQARPIIVPICLSTIPLFLFAALAAMPLALIGKSDVAMTPLLLGWFVVLAGAACDITATVRHSPNLAREANPVIRSLLDNGISLNRVFWFGGILQALFVSLACILWFGFLKHRETLVATMPPNGSLMAYLKAGTGARELNYRQWLCPFTYAELPWAYHLTWWCGIGFVGVSLYRFYLAMEWYRLVPIHPWWIRLIAPTVLLIFVSWAYADWLKRSTAALTKNADTIDDKA